MICSLDSLLANDRELAAQSAFARPSGASTSTFHPSVVSEATRSGATCDELIETVIT